MVTLYPCSSSVPITAVSDAWHHHALGKSAESIWKILLTRGEATTKQLAEQTGRGIRTVRRALNKLWMHGLAMPIGGGFWVAEPADECYLQTIAEVYGTFGSAEQRKTKHMNERAALASKLIRDQKNNWDQRHSQENSTIDGSCVICNKQK